MRAIFVTALSGLLLVVASCSPSSKPAYRDPDGAFTVAFPDGAQPTATTERWKSEEGELPGKQYVAQSKSRKTRMTIQVYDVRGHELEAQSGIDAWVTVWRNDSTSFSMSKVDIDGRAGHEVTRSTANGSQFISRAVYAGQKIYTLSLTFEPGTEAREIETAKRALASFRFTSPKTEADEWTLLRDRGGFFTVSFPTWISVATIMSDVEFDEGKIPEVRHDGMNEGVRTLVEIFDFRGQRARADRFRDGTIAQWKASATSLRSDSATELDGHKGREISFATADYEQTTRFFALGSGRLYAVTIAWQPSANAARIADAKRFLGSFHFVSPQPDDWELFKDPDGAFTVSFPSRPQTEREKKSDLIKHVFGSPDDGPTMFVIVRKMKAQLADAEIAKRYAAEYSRRMPHVISQSQIQLQGRSGRQVESGEKSGARGTVRIFGSAGKMYAFGVEPTDNADQGQLADLRRFLDSFQFTR